MSTSHAIEYARFEVVHAEGVAECAGVLEWPSYVDPAVVRAAFLAPGAVSWVATHRASVIGLAHLLTDGVVQSHLSLVGVLPDYRRGGVARKLVTAAFQQAGSKWLDLCSKAGAEEFYRSFLHQERDGFRIYPTDRDLGSQPRRIS